MIRATVTSSERRLPLAAGLQARAMEAMSDKSIPEFAAFGFTLALRMQNLLKGGRPPRGAPRRPTAAGL